VDPVQSLIQAAAIPAGVAAAVFLALAALRRGRDVPVVIVIAIGFAAGWAALNGVPRGLPIERWHWILWAAPVAAVAGLLEGPKSRWPLRLALCAAAAYATDAHPAALRVALNATWVLVSWEALESGVARAGPRPALAIAVTVAAAMSVALVVSGSAVLGATCGPLAAAAGACLALSWWRPAGTQGLVALTAVLVAMFSLNGRLYAGLGFVPSAILALAPLAAGVPLPAKLSTPRASAIVRVAAVALACGAAIAVAVVESPPLEY
jgi:hypothetical protein